MSELDALKALESYIGQARWFGGKGRGGNLGGLEQGDWIVAPGGDTPPVRAEFATIDYPDGSHEYYQVLVSYRDQPLEGCLIGPALEPELGHAHDAPRDVEAMRGVLKAVLKGAPSGSSWTAKLPDASRLKGDLEPRVFGGEQSNTNVLVGDVALMKIFRKLEVGPNLDIQMHDALGRAHVSSAARLYGWVSGSLTPADAQDGERVDLVMISELLRDAQDGWELACDFARQGKDFSEHAGKLGQALAEVHQALADTFGTSQGDGSAVAGTMASRLEQAAAAAPALAPHVDGLRAAFGRLEGKKLRTQRVHGDFHLGQTLFTPSGWKIIDFEGEPMKSFAERQEPDSALRDVAGMLRSFGYATSAFAEPTGEAAQQWLASSRAAFLGAYRKGAEPIDDVVLAAYEADKAIYEVVYETRNRPDWVQIPLSALQAIAPSAEQEK